ncbi:MAG: SDR family oxidoreductase [Myxococcales bacterium]|nr:SDR family oxidoreductase [Myxococcales bacterium]MDH3485625.1 SDR family oxidoreductase [Myxococcales bacterium]
MKKSFAGKVAIITGSAQGIGKALAEELGDRGCYLVLADINGALLEKVASDLRAAGADVEATKVDVRDPRQVEVLIRGAFQELGRIDYLFNNAGINVLAELLDTSLGDWNRLIDVNLRGVVHGVHAAYPLMCEQGFGHIINIASVAGLAPTPAEGAYAATKHAVVGLSTTLRIEAAAFGIKVSVVCPGAVDTPILHASKHVKFDSDAITELSPEKPMAPRQAARLILRGVERGRFFIVISKTANAFWRAYRLAPEGSLLLGQLAMKRIRAIKRDA